ncbi:hypothetical protein A3K55_02140 [Candidatus Shapirobacteria bacterium RBG_13_44_7]|uniref:Uncharacterized protein n=1 Tax=Candidatus Shapirobacteria bacterium RBG_13_44_7 TaxID=1802149 RepID=A0A1F7SGL1_9BACT|nr:MAG: hypothetical protein A3K55_02140 [Candidatus Shapirobacteria bacterium RBG_13_44_7]
MANKTATVEAEVLIYCRTAGELAACVGRRCTRKLHVSGDGVGGENDKYGEHYVRPCRRSGRRVLWKKNEIPIAGCL